VYSDCGHQSRIVHLNPGDIAHNKQFSPFLMYGQTVRQQPQLKSDPMLQQVYVCLAQIGDEATAGSRLKRRCC
jgi:hypothetical protein